MRFHHSTRRGRNRLAHQSAAYHHYQQAALGAGSARLPLTGSGSAAGRWSQLAYCRKTSIHFNRRLPVAPPESLQQQPQQQQIDSPAPEGELLSVATNEAGGGGGFSQSAAESPLIELTQEQRQCQAQSQTLALDSRMNELSLEESNTNSTNNTTTNSSTTSMTTSTIIPNPNLKHKQRKLLPSENKKGQHAFLLQDDAQDLIKIQTEGKLDMESARQKLVAQVEKHPFWSNKAAKRMRLTGVEVRRVYIYELISYCERRELEWKYEPYRGGLVRATPYRRVLASNSAPGSSPATSGIATANTTPGPSPAQLQHPSTAPVSGNNFYYSTSNQTSDIDGNLVPEDSRQFTYSNQQHFDHQSTSDQQQHQSLGRQSSAPRTMSPASMASSGFVAESVDQRTGSSMGGSLLAGGAPQPSSITRTPVRRANSSHLVGVVASSIAHLNSPVAVNSPTLVGHNLYLQQQQSTTLTGTMGSAATNTTTTNSTDGHTYRFESTGNIDNRRMEPDAQLIWSIEIPPHVQPAPFAGCVHSTELPNSSFVKRCHGCQGRGRLKCNSCYGVGYEVCISCSGKGTTKSLSSGLGSSGPFSSSNLTSGRAGHYGSSRSSYGDNDEDSGGAFSTSQASNSRGRNEPGGITSSSGSSSAWVTESCHYCHGAGQKRCWVCAGKSYNHCFGCNGTGQLRCYLNVNITWINHRDESILNNTDNIIPKERLRLSSGPVLIDQIAERLAPLSSSLPSVCLPKEGASNSTGTTGETSTNTRASLRHRNHQQQPYKQPGGATSQHQPKQQQQGLDCLNDARQLESVSRRFLERHLNSYKQERLIRQRQRVTQIECHIVSYEWKQRRGHFVIYGDERKVYIAKYPFKSLCSIT